MNIILEKMGCSKKKFLSLCKYFDPAISKPTILNLINGKGKRLPSVETLSIVIKVCHTYGEGDLKRVSYDYLLNDEITKLTPENLDSYEEFGLSFETLSFFHIENTIGLFERDTMRGVNEFIPNIRRNFFTQVSIANKLVEILKLMRMLYDGKENQKETISRVLECLNNSYLKSYLKTNKCLVPYLKKLESRNDKETIEILFDIFSSLDSMYSESKYFLIDSINEYYQKREENLYKYDDISLTKEEQDDLSKIKEQVTLEEKEDRRKSNIRRINKKERNSSNE